MRRTLGDAVFSMLDTLAFATHVKSCLTHLLCKSLLWTLLGFNLFVSNYVLLSPVWGFILTLGGVLGARVGYLKALWAPLG